MIDEKLVPSVEKEEEGASMVEYALLVALIAIIAIVAVRFLGTSINAQFENIAQTLNDPN